MSLLRHRLVTAYKLIEYDAIEPNDLGWLSHHYWNGHTYQVIMSWRLYAKHGDSFDCNCADRRIRRVECADIKATKIYIERHKEVKA